MEDILELHPGLGAHDFPLGECGAGRRSGNAATRWCGGAAAGCGDAATRWLGGSVARWFGGSVRSKHVLTAIGDLLPP
jgi:hypothetical protein